MSYFLFSDLRACAQLQSRVYGLICIRKHRDIIFSFKVCKIATHSCTEQAAGSYSRPGNIHEYLPLSPSSLFYKCPFRIPGPLLIVTVNANTAEHAAEELLHLIFYEEKFMFSLVVQPFLYEYILYHIIIFISA